MPAGSVMKRILFFLFLLTCLSGALGDTLAAPADSAAQTAESQEAVRTGAGFERSRRWLEAIEHYENSLKSWPENKDLEYGLRRSKIHFAIERRYADSSFETTLWPMSQPDGIELFNELMEKIRSNYVDPLSYTSFVAHGTESLYLALANDKFIAKNIPAADPQRIAQMRTVLREQYWNKPVPTREAAVATITEVCQLAQRHTGLHGGAVVQEYIFGGCNALDDYSNFLTPDRLNDLYGNIEGEFVGLGIEMKAELGKGLLLVNVLPDSPAQQGGLRRGDFIVTVEGLDCRKMSTDEAAKLLRGPSGSRVRLERMRGPEQTIEEGVFIRRAVHVKSIPVAKIIDSEAGIGYIQMSGFQKTSAQELDAALASLERQGMRALIWDVRGNPGGLLTAAVEVLDRFIDQGVLVSTKGRTSDQNWTYSAHRPGTHALPLVLLVDGDSASASEIVAGAIRDHRRGIVVGRTTFGKWSVQSIFPVRYSTGLRLTTAKFYSPNGHTLGKIGVRPDVAVEVPTETAHISHYRGPEDVNLEADLDLRKGVDLLRREVTQR
jgi:carboxyl-terminal processing protease